MDVPIHFKVLYADKRGYKEPKCFVSSEHQFALPSVLKDPKLTYVKTDSYLHQTASGVECHFVNPPAQPTATNKTWQ